MNYIPTIGLEIHSELKTKSKMFCSSPNDPDEKHPNVNICPICLAHPGTLPVINEEAVRHMLRIGFALHCDIPTHSKFDRKSYFYPDLPKGYQISQYDMPLCVGGYLEINLSNPSRMDSNDSRIFEKNSVTFGGNSRKIRIRRIHLEEDTGRLIHPEGADYSLVDFNRAGVPLMELVTEPELSSAEEAVAFAKELQRILRYLEASDADMEKGQMRVEVNISLSNPSRMISNESRIMLKDESYKLMSLLFEIHNKLGPIYKEKNYQDAIEEILKREHVPFEREKLIALKFENLTVSDFFADFVIGGNILLEIKAKAWITQDDIRQASRYIKSLNIPLAIIVNFKRQKLEYKRIVNPVFESDSSLFEEDSRNPLGTKVEIKNLNSFRAVQGAVAYEIERQTGILEKGEKVIQETRGWDDIKQVTFSQRIKEEAHDYRYFPEPDLPPLEIVPPYFDTEAIQLSVPELPQAKRDRFIKEFGLTGHEVEILVEDRYFAEFFENTMTELIQWAKEKGIQKIDQKRLAVLAANYAISDLNRLMNETGIKVREFLMTPENFAELLRHLYENKISSRVAKDVLAEIFKTGGDPSDIIHAKGLFQVSSASELEGTVKRVIEENPQAVEDYKKGKTNAVQFLVGKVMGETKGKSNPEVARQMIEKILSG